MAKRRTKDQKRKAAARRQSVGVELLNSTPSPTLTTSVIPAAPTLKTPSLAEALAAIKNRDTSSVIPAPSPDLQQFFGFDPKLLYQDLTKTIVVSAVILVGLVVFSQLAF